MAVELWERCGESSTDVVAYRAETADLMRQWQKQLAAVAIPSEHLEGWQRGMTQLQQLTRRLNGLDEQKGKYMTVSELKPQVFAITQSLNQIVPAEEQLRQLAVQSTKNPASVALRAQTELHLKQLMARYALLDQLQKEQVVSP